MHQELLTTVVCIDRAVICSFKAILFVLVALCSAFMRGVHSNNLNQNTVGLI